MDILKNIHVAVLVANGFEQSEMTEPKRALEEAGATTKIVSPVSGKVKGWNKKNWGEEFTVDEELTNASPDDFDALLLPGGVINPDTLRIDLKALELVKHFIKKQKPIAAICHGPWTLINAEGVKGKRLTSWPSIKIDLINAGARWEDEEVILDENLVTSRKPEDIPAFSRTFINLLSKKTHAVAR
jgi:protease I